MRGTGGGRSSTRSQSGWSSLRGPVTALVWLLIALALVEIYRSAEFVVVHVVDVLLLFVFAAIIALLVTPLVDRLQRLAPFRRSRVFAVLVLYLGLVAVIVGAGALIAPYLVSQARELPGALASLQQQLEQHGVSVQLPTLAGRAGDSALAPALAVVTGTVTAVVNVLLVTVISVYLCAEGRTLIAALERLIPADRRAFDFTMLALGSTIAAYARGQLLMSTLMGVYTGVVMTVLGVHYAVLLGIAAFLLEFIPLVGAPVVMALAAVVALFQSPLLGLIAAIAGLVGHAIEAYIVGPRVSGRVTRLHPLVAMAALLVGAELAGVLGALFAVPIAAVANVLLGALYRARRGVAPLTTSRDGEVREDALPRLGDEIGELHEPGELVATPVPHARHESRRAGSATPGST